MRKAILLSFIFLLLAVSSAASAATSTEITETWNSVKTGDHLMVRVNESAAFAANESNVHIDSYSWTVDGAGVAGSGMAYTGSFPDEGTHNVSVTATNTSYGDDVHTWHVFVIEELATSENKLSSYDIEISDYTDPVKDQDFDGFLNAMLTPFYLVLGALFYLVLALPFLGNWIVHRKVNLPILGVMTLGVVLFPIFPAQYREICILFIAFGFVGGLYALFKE